ncbi:hypothetical protein ACJZ2D_006880 [Fusarium nematophilum]
MDMNNTSIHNGTTGASSLSRGLDISCTLVSTTALEAFSEWPLGYKVVMFPRTRVCKSSTKPKNRISPTTKSVRPEQDIAIEDGDPTGYRLERIVGFLFSHSISGLIRKIMISYLRDEVVVEPIKPCSWLEVVTDLPSMLLDCMPLLIPLWVYTEYYWTSLFGLMIWDRIGSSVTHWLLSRAIGGLHWALYVAGDVYHAVFRTRGLAAMSKGLQVCLNWIDWLDGGALRALAYSHPDGSCL